MEQEKEKKKQNQNQISIHDILPLDLIQRILLRLPVKKLARLRCVSKLWCSLTSDPHLAELHLQHSPEPTLACLFIEPFGEAHLVHPEELFTDRYYEIEDVSLPFKKTNPPSIVCVMGSCRGFILLNVRPHFLVVWNPLTGSRKKISYSFIVSRSVRPSWATMFQGVPALYGLGYDASQDDYLVVVGWLDINYNHHLDYFSLRTNSWINLDAALPKPLDSRGWKCRGLFLNGSIHWLMWSSHHKVDSEALLTFDLKERSFSMISIPEQLLTFRQYRDADLGLLGGCLAIYCRGYDADKTDIWVMKDYKVHSSWTLCVIPGLDVKPLCLSNGGDIIALDCLPPLQYRRLWFAKYNLREDLLQRFECPPLDPYHLHHENYYVYTESLLLLPSYSKHKKKKKEKKKKKVM